MNPNVFVDISAIQLLDVQTVTAVKELIIQQYDPPPLIEDSAPSTNPSRPPR
jgi:hypothetical protein